MTSELPERNLGPEPPTPEPEADDLPYGKLALTLCAVLAVFGGSIALMYWEKTLSDYPTPPLPEHLERPDKNGVNQVVFRLEDFARQSRSQQLARLDSYGWVDRDAGIAHIPIEEAMTLVAAGARQALAPPPPAPARPPDGGTP